MDLVRSTGSVTFHSTHVKLLIAAWSVSIGSCICAGNQRKGSSASWQSSKCHHRGGGSYPGECHEKLDIGEDSTLILTAFRTGTVASSGLSSLHTGLVGSHPSTIRLQVHNFAHMSHMRMWTMTPIHDAAPCIT
jgi:hypothetical protein